MVMLQNILKELSGRTLKNHVSGILISRSTLPFTGFLLSKAKHGLEVNRGLKEQYDMLYKLNT